MSKAEEIVFTFAHKKLMDRQKVEMIESYAKEHALSFQKYITELYGIGGFEEDDEIEYNEWKQQSDNTKP